MRYALVLNNPELGDVDVSQEAVEAMQVAFGEYVKALDDAGVLITGEILQASDTATTVTLRGGSLEVQDGPFADTKDKLAGVFVLDVPDLDAALAWAEKCPGATYGVLEVRPVGIHTIGGTWVPDA
ncbi:YciI family protein [Humibacter sp. RRB41]|uniref:YciI family protein n=1 Tax=Humibacter sp. RRB41 TaxID=2919946 RepID=UPI001FAA8E5D|nr:YciI family protein [Humibacter sp. RRB41]